MKHLGRWVPEPAERGPPAQAPDWPRNAVIPITYRPDPDIAYSALAEATGRKPDNLSRTLNTMSNYGIVEMKWERNNVRPTAKATEFRIVA
jgi:hypothetical protein